MKIESLPTNVSEVVRNNNGLKMYLNNLDHGKPATPRSWLYEGQSDTEVLSLWLAKLERLKTSNEFDKLVFQYEESFLEKFGPQGAVKPVKELMDLVTEGYKSVSFSSPAVFRSPEWNRAKRRVVERLFKDNHLYHVLRPKSLHSVVDDMRARDTLESNSGYPLFTRRNKPEVVAQSVDDAESRRCYEYPAILLFRNYNGKTRPVWMYPMSVNLIEGSFTQPLKEALMSVDNSSTFFFAPWRGFEEVQWAITVDYYGDGSPQRGSKSYLSASDFSHTDAHFTKWAMLEVYDVIKHAFQSQYWEDLKKSMLHVVDIDLIASSDTYITGDHGVSSGSNWTNDAETYFDYIAEEYLVELGIVDETADAIGDDIRHKRHRYDPQLAEKLAREYSKMGFEVNAEKVTNERDWVKYLQRLFMRGQYSKWSFTSAEGTQEYPLRGVYRTIKALNSSLNPEKFHSPKLWNKDMFAARQFMILENCLDHPLFEEFVKFVCDGHPYLREFAQLNSKRLDEITRQSHLVPGLNPTYNQEKRDKSLATFKSIEIARNL